MKPSIHSTLVALVAMLLLIASPQLRAQSQPDTTISEADMRKYNALYLEAVCQREQGNDVAQYHLLKRALEVNPRGADAYYDLAEIAISKGLDYVPALLYLQLAHQYAPQNEDYTLTCAMALINSSDHPQDGLDMMQTLLQSTRMRNDAFEILVDYYERTGDYDQLVATLEKWRPIKGDDENISYLKLHSAIELERYDDALLICDTLINTVPASADFYRVLKGQVYAQSGDSDNALRLYNEVIATNPNMPEAQLLLLSYAIYSSDDDIRRKALFAIITNPEHNPDLRTNAYNDYINSFKPQDQTAAIDSLLNHLLYQADNTAQLLLNITQNMDEQHYADSLYIPVCKKILEISPEDQTTRTRLLLCLAQHSRYDEMKQWALDGIKLHPDQILFRYFLGNTYLIEKNTDDALQTIREGLPFITDETSNVYASIYYSLLGDCLHERGDNDQAYAAYDQALQYNSLNTTCLNNYAYFLSLEKRDLDKAETLSEKAINLESSSAIFLDTYAWILFVKKEYRRAAQYIDRALSNISDPDDSSNSSLYDHAGDIYYHLGQRDKAMRHWRKAAKLKPDSALIQKKIKNAKYFEK